LKENQIINHFYQTKGTKLHKGLHYKPPRDYRVFLVLIVLNLNLKSSIIII